MTLCGQEQIGRARNRAGGWRFSGVFRRLGLAALITAALAPASWAHPGHHGSGLVGWWTFDDGNAALATDSSGLGNDGVLGGGAVPTTDAVRGKALDFTDDDAQVTIPFDPSLQPATGTIEVWVKVDTPQNSDIFVAVSDCAIRTDPTCANVIGISVIGLRIQADGGAHAFIADDHAPDDPWAFATAPAGLITLGRWHHLAMRWDGAKLALFVDGFLRDTTSYDAIPGSGLSYHGDSDMYLGVGTASFLPEPHEFIGQMDDVRFYSRARSWVDIFTDYVTRGRTPAKAFGH